MNGTCKSTLAIGLLITVCGAACGSGGQGQNPVMGATSGSSGSVGGATGSAPGTGVPATTGGTGGATGATGDTAGTGVPATSGSMDTSGASSGTGGTQDAGAVSDAGGDAADAAMTETGAAQGPCTTSTLKPGNSTLMIQSSGMARSYILHVPPKYDGKTRLPLVIEMHGKGSSAQQEISWSGWAAKADAVGFVVIYPQGLYASWNAGPPGCPTLMCCCQPAQDYKIDDASFIRAVVTKTAQDGCIDLKRVYATGLSNGGIMSQWLACDAADMFAAVAPVSGPNMIDCKPSRPISVVLYRGTQDTGVIYNGGAQMPGGHVWPSAMADFAKWRNLDQCTDAPMPMPMHPACLISSTCAGGAEVVLCSPTAPHNLYGAAMSQMLGVADVAWEVLQRHSLP